MSINVPYMVFTTIERHAWEAPSCSNRSPARTTSAHTVHTGGTSADSRDSLGAQEVECLLETRGKGEMSTALAPGIKTEGSAAINAIRLGFWSALLTVVLAAVFMVMGIATPPRSGPLCGNACVPYPYTDVAAFIPQDYIWLYPGFLLAPAFVVLMACIHNHAADGKKVFSRIGLSFALLYAAVIMVDYFIQLEVVVPSLQAGETAGLSLFTQYNPHGLFIVFEALGYLLMSVALLFTAPVFEGGQAERAVRWLFVASFVLAVVAFAALAIADRDIVAFEVTILLIDWIVLIVGGALTSLAFWRAGHAVVTRRAAATAR